MNRSLTINGTLSCFTLNNNNLGITAATNSTIEYLTTQDINKGFDYGNLILNYPHDFTYKYFNTSNDIYIYGIFQIGYENDYTFLTIGTAFSPNGYTIYCNNLTDNGSIYDIDMITLKWSPGSIYLTNLSNNVSKLKGISPALYSYSGIIGVTIEYCNLAFGNTTNRVDNFLSMDYITKGGASIMDFENGNTVFYDNLYCFGYTATSLGSGKINQAPGLSILAHLSETTDLKIGTMNKLEIYNSYYTSSINDGLIREYFYTKGPVNLSGTLKIGTPTSNIANGDININGGTIEINGTSSSPTTLIQGNLTNLKLKSYSNTLLNGYTILSGNCTFYNGSLDLNGNILELKNSSWLGETALNFVKDNSNGSGFIRTSTLFPGGPINQLNASNIGLILSTDNDPGMLDISRYMKTTTANNETSINRNYQILTQNQVHVPYAKVNYSDFELNGNLESSSTFNLKTSTDNISWTDQSSSRNSNTNWVSSNLNISTPIIYFTLCDNSNFLKPIQSNKYKQIESAIFPNPFTETLTWQIKSEQLDVVHVQLFDLSGKCVFTSTQDLIQGNNQIQFNGFENLAQGTYLFVATGNNTMVQSKVVKF